MKSVKEIVVLLACVGAMSAQDHNVAAIKQALVRTGVPMPLTISVPEGRTLDPATLEISNANAVGEMLWIRIRCRPRNKCGEAMATLRYTDSEQAQTAALALAGPIRRRQRRGPPIVRAGSNVVLVLEDPKMRLQLSAVALNSGSIGDRIRVRDRETKKIHSGVVAGPEEVRENL